MIKTQLDAAVEAAFATYPANVKWMHTVKDGQITLAVELPFLKAGRPLRNAVSQTLDEINPTEMAATLRRWADEKI